MTIVQISKQQQRFGLSEDIPQLDTAELGFATDTRRLYIGNDLQLYPPDSVLSSQTEVLTSYSPISFNQIDGNDANLLIQNKTDGQIIRYDASTMQWTNGGGSASGNINLGHISNLSIGGGGGGFVMTTDGIGNLDWTHKGYVVNDPLMITSTNPAVINTVADHYMLNGSPMTITNIAGFIASASLVTGTGAINALTTSNTVGGVGTNFTSALIGKTLLDSSNQYIGVIESVESTTELKLKQNSAILVTNSSFKTGSSSLNGNTYYAKVLTNNTVQIFTDPSLTSGFDASTYTPYISLSGRIVTNILAPAGGGSAAGLHGEVQLNISNALGTVSTLKYNTSSNTLFALNFSGNMSGNGSRLSGITGSNVVGTVPNAQFSINSGIATSAGTVINPIQGNITSVGNLVSLNVTGNSNFNEVRGSGNITLNNNKFIKGNLNNSNSTTRIIGIDNSNLMYIGGVDTGLSGVAIMNNGIQAIRVDDASNVFITRDLTVLGNLNGVIERAVSVVGNIQPNITQTGTMISLNVSGLTQLSDTSVSGNLVASTLSGSGVGITSITGENVTGFVPNAVNANTANLATTALTVSNGTQSAITSVGTLTSLNISGNETVAGNLGVGTMSPTSKLHVVGNADITGTVSSGPVVSSGTVTASGLGGFASSTYAINQRNPIWRFTNSGGYGISYFHGTSGTVGDTIGFHFGTATIETSTLQLNQTSVNSNAPLTEYGHRVLTANSYQSYNVFNILAANTLVASGNQNSAIGTTTPELGGMKVVGNGNAAFIAFHRPGQWATYFGLDSDNVFKIGGWSLGNTAYTVLHSGNFNTYSPTLSGIGANGTWGISITGTAGTAVNALNIPPETNPGDSSVRMGRNGKNGIYSYGTYDDPNAPTSYTASIGFGKGSAGSGEIAVNWGAGNGLWYRSLRDVFDPWTSWVRVLDSSNYNNYSPTLTGGNASGTWNINVSGIASSATRLNTARTINGVLFDGTSNITIPSDYKITSGSSDASDRQWYITYPSDIAFSADLLDLDTRIATYSNSRAFDSTQNMFWVLSPAGYTTADLVAFMPSIKQLHFAGDVNGDDSIRCEWAIHDTRYIKVWVQATEQRAFPEAHWIAIWKK